MRLATSRGSLRRMVKCGVPSLRGASTAAPAGKTPAGGTTRYLTTPWEGTSRSTMSQVFVTGEPATGVAGPPSTLRKTSKAACGGSDCSNRQPT